MVERVSRKGDERVYQPQLRAELVSELWRIKQETGIPMTVLIETAVKEFVERHQGTTSH